MSAISAEKQAWRLLCDYMIEGPPVPVERLAENLGAEIVYQPFEGDVSGMLFRDESQSRSVIGVNSAHASKRQRFTVAHEIGHLKLHEGKPVFVDSFGGRINLRDGTSDNQEVEANAFAAELLMPKAFLLSAVKEIIARRGGTSPGDLVNELAKTFRVSKESMNYRLQNLGFIDPTPMVS